jgi:hypothetical protein
MANKLTALRLDDQLERQEEREKEKERKGEDQKGAAPKVSVSASKPQSLLSSVLRSSTATENGLLPPVSNHSSPAPDTSDEFPPLSDEERRARNQEYREYRRREALQRAKEIAARSLHCPTSASSPAITNIPSSTAQPDPALRSLQSEGRAVQNHSAAQLQPVGEGKISAVPDG